MEWLAVLLALLAGLTYASAAVLQQRVAAQQAPELSLSPRLILALVKRPLWLLGTLFDVCAYLFEAAALGVGSVIIVGPLLVSGLLFALPLSTIGTGARVTRREMVPAVMVTAGLAVFVVVGSPEGGSAQASMAGWAIAGAFVGIVVVSLTFVARAARGASRALLLGIATGTLYGLTAVLTKSTVDLFDRGVLETFGHWQPYALAVCSVAGLVLNQSAFQAGNVGASLPAIAVVNPILACVFGVTLFDEVLGVHSAVGWAVTVLAIVAMVVGTIRLSRSPLVTHDLNVDDEESAPVAAP